MNYRIIWLIQQEEQCNRICNNNLSIVLRILIVFLERFIHLTKVLANVEAKVIQKALRDHPFYLELQLLAVRLPDPLPLKTWHLNNVLKTVAPDCQSKMNVNFYPYFVLFDLWIIRELY